MRCLTTSEQAVWVKERKLARYPYHQDKAKAPRHYIQFRAPDTLSAVEAFTHTVCDTFWNKEDALLAIEDWALYQPYEMYILDCVRKAHAEIRNLIDASGHVYQFSEKDALIGTFSLTVGYRWTSYLFLPEFPVIFMNYEGVLMDFWTDSAACVDAILPILSRFKLERT